MRSKKYIQYTANSNKKFTINLKNLTLVNCITVKKGRDKINPKCSAENIYSTPEEMDAVENYSNMKPCIVREPESLEPVLASCVTVTVKENTWNGARYLTENQKLYCFDTNKGEFLREYALSIPN